MNGLLKKIGMLGLVCILICSIVFLAKQFTNNNSEGAKYIREQENLDSLEEKKVLTKIREEEMKEAIENGEVSVYSLFDSCVFYGDSRVDGFVGIFHGAAIYAEKGDTIDDIEKWDENITKMQPSKVFLAYGINDLGLKLDEIYDGYGKQYEKMIKEHILKYVPNTKICVNSIIRATPEAMDKSPCWYKLDEYNKQIKEMCEENGWIYIDNDKISDGSDSSYYTDDGIHFTPDFTEEWLRYMYEMSE